LRQIRRRRAPLLVRSYTSLQKFRPNADPFGLEPLDWKEILRPEDCNYVLGNPPFVGAKFQTDEQRTDMDTVAAQIQNYGLLDYVTGWYFKAAEYVQGTRIVVGFVSTNSITQGEQVGVLWNPLFQRYNLKIHFAHRTFSWESEARGKAHVHVVIVGFGAFDTPKKHIYDYEGETVTVINAKNISPYLVEGSDVAITNRSKPLSAVPEMKFGNQPIDGGHFILDAAEKEELIKKEPGAAKFIRPFLGAQEFINGEDRWCLWLADISPNELRSMPEVKKRVELVREFRLKSRRAATRELSAIPTRFAFVSHPNKEYLLVPSVSSEHRPYIQIGFEPAEVIASNLCLMVADATLYHFGVLSSAMHMTWVRQVCGRLKSDYRYSNKLVYNNFPWPDAPTDKQRAAVEAAAQAVLDARKAFPDATLADLYDPVAMPPTLVKAHAALDRAVDLCYRPQAFENDRQRVEYLFALYQKLLAPLIPPSKKAQRKRT